MYQQLLNQHPFLKELKGTVEVLGLDLGLVCLILF